MPVQLTVFFIIIYMFLSLAIIVQSSLVIAVLGKEWVQVKRLSPLDMILAGLGISHFFRQWASVLYNFYSRLNSTYAFWKLTVIWDLANTVTFWFTSLLAVFHCVKVSTFTHPIFLWLKWRIARLVPWLLLSFLLFSCVTVIPSIFRNLSISQITMENSPRNRSITDRIKKFSQYVTMPEQMVTLGIPFLLCLGPTILLMASLSQHLKQLQNFNTGHCSSSTKAHSMALRSLAISLTFFTSYFFISFVTSLGLLLENRFCLWAWEVVTHTVICIHSTSLMLSSLTLRKFLKKRL